MRPFYSFILLLCCWLAAGSVSAQKKSEKDLMQDIVNIIQTGDDSAYALLFPTYKMMAELVYDFQPKDEIQGARINRLRSNMRHLRQYDPELTPSIIDMMNFVRQKGADSGIHWGDILVVKYELDKQRLPYELIGFELIAPLRMQGYIFIRDMLTRKRYGIAVRDIFLMNDKWYGGSVLNILEASNVLEYEQALAMEEKELKRLMVYKEMGVLDSVLAARDSIRKAKLYPSGYFDEEEEEAKHATMFKDIAERKLYKGYFDKQIDVDLYVRSIKGTCPEQICSWEAMYRFGDMDDFIVLEVEKKPDGTFVFTEEELGVMELKLQGNTFTGTWTSVSDKTEYEVYLKEEEAIKDRKLFKLDREFEELKWQ